MEKAFEFLSRHKDVALATAEGNIPKVRVFQIMKQEGHTLYFATGPQKDIYRQLQENPQIEILGMYGNISVRMGGSVHFDVDDKTCRDIFRDNQVLQRLYADYAALVYFRFTPEWSDYYDLTPTPPVFEHNTYA